jgi:putative chitinase
MALNPEEKESADYLLQYAQSKGITDRKELSNFMGQMQYESRNFSSLEESFDYSGKRLYQVFPGRNGMNSLAKADDIAKGSPKDIADAVYGGEFGRKQLGNIQPDDGWNFRGRGFIQLTGRGEYEKVGRELGLDLGNHPDLVATKEVAAKAAVQYWKDKIVARNAQEDIDKTTGIINSASEGLAGRKAYAAAWESKLEKGYKPGDPELTPSRTLKQGMHGDDVTHAQGELQALGYLHVAPDSRFGSKTEAAVEAFQRTEGLPVDGKIGTNTQKSLDGALRDKQISDLTSGLPSLREFSDLHHPQNALYNTLRDGFPGGTSPEVLSQATATCYMSGIRQPNDLGNVTCTNGRIFFDTESLLARPAQLDLNQQAPSVQQTMQQVQQFDQQQSQIQAQVQQANQQANMQQGPVMGGPQMGR